MGRPPVGLECATPGPHVDLGPDGGVRLPADGENLDSAHRHPSVSLVYKDNLFVSLRRWSPFSRNPLTESG